MNDITLRPITEMDTDLVVKWRNYDEVKSRFIRREFTAEMHTNWLRTMVFPGKVAQFIIECNGRPVGSSYLRDIDKENKSAEFGIFIGESDARGKGCGTNAVKSTVEYGFNELKLHRIFLRVLSGNEAAIRCYQKVGFSYEGTARDMVYLDGKFIDVIFMSIINEGV